MTEYDAMGRALRLRNENERLVVENHELREQVSFLTRRVERLEKLNENYWNRICKLHEELTKDENKGEKK